MLLILPDCLAREFRLAYFALIIANRLHSKSLCIYGLLILFILYLVLALLFWLNTKILVLEVVLEKQNLQDEFSELVLSSQWKDTAKESLKIL